MSIDTHMDFKEQPVNRFSSHPDLRDWTRVLGPQDKHLDPWTIRTTSLALNTEILGNRRTLHHTTWAHDTTFPLAAFPWRAHCGPTQRALFQKLCSETQERLWALQRSLPWQPDRMCLNKGDARPSPSIPIPPSHPSRVTKVPVWPSWVMMFHWQTGRGGAEITRTCPVSWKSPSCFSILYNNLFFFFLQTWDKECLGKRNSPTYFYSQEHALTAQGQRPTLGKGPVQSL